MPTHTDEELLSLYRRTGDMEWLGKLLQRYTVLLLGVALKYLKDREAAADAVQAVFLKALTHLPDGEIRNFKGWLYVLVRNQALQVLRDDYRHVPEGALETVIAPEVLSDNEHWEQEFTLEQMKMALARLPQEQRISLELFYLKRMSYGEVQAETGYSFAQVKSYIQNGKRALRLLLQKKKTL